MVAAATAAAMGETVRTVSPSPHDVAQWRKEKRQQLLAGRAALPQEARAAAARQVSAHVLQVLDERSIPFAGLTVSGYWPIKSELDLRPLLIACISRGARAALPLVETKASPLVFREWTPETKMQRSFWNIPVPASTAVVVPDILLSPLVGWDSEGYRLGYGGGHFDRTLAVLKSPRLVIGVGLQSAAIDTIFPQPHDVRMDVIVTDAGMQWCAP